jgi:hypothetical protein
MLKKGLYVTNIYYLKEIDKTGFKEFIASKLRFPSYISLEYVLGKYNFLSEATYPLTSITTKVPRTYHNFLGTYKYSNIKEQLYFGFNEVSFYHIKRLNDVLGISQKKDIYKQLFEKIKNIDPNYLKEDILPLFEDTRLYRIIL